MLKIFLEILKENGELSSTRLIMLISFTSVLSMWSILCIEKQELQEIPESVLTLLGLLLATKWAQKIEEKEK